MMLNALWLMNWLWDWTHCGI